MNTDHAGDNLVIVRAFGAPDAEAARMTGLDSGGGDWAATVAGADVPVRISWPQPVTERPRIRTAVVDLYQQACSKLGLPSEH
ncbi:DUF2470 domain-containing protein [Flexivirga caeni]|uniref:DUF2470 domain-containing protein n=2 Tax=Flexivirga caeni TaxID=2294115 RepID=A0A3M9M740_9MICO|nr:DUF2470 domain-containing protein [Flexivirga caeni]